jgi:hypothetical protein
MRILIATVGLAAFVAGCATPTPTPVPTAELLVAGTVRQDCGSWGGCAYFIAIEGPGGSWRAEFGYDGEGEELAGAEGLPRTVPPGTYTLTLSSFHVSDHIVNGVRELESADATCSTTLNVRGDQPILIQGTFDKGSCEVRVTA